MRIYGTAVKYQPELSNLTVEYCYSDQLHLNFSETEQPLLL